MQRISTTPFGRRPVSAGLLAARALAEAPSPSHAVDKWQVFRDLTTARPAFGLSSRTLTVLNALLFFHPEAALGGDAPIIVFPSNRALADRAHGMSEVTLRRHLAALVEAGLLLRHDSPNGKRYAARDASGKIARAFGFDLRPLMVRADEIAQAARVVRETAERGRRAREAVVLMLRDAAKLIAYGREAAPGPHWAALEAELTPLRLALRRHLAIDEIEALRGRVADLLLLASVETLGRTAIETAILSGNASPNERHIQTSDTDILEFEPCEENTKAISEGSSKHGEGGGHAPEDRCAPKLPLSLVLKACPALDGYFPDPVRSWRDLVIRAAELRGWLGISADAWDRAADEMGPEVAAITVACMLERTDEIRSPGGYLRRLTAKAATGEFSPGPMIMALVNRPDRQAA